MGGRGLSGLPRRKGWTRSPTRAASRPRGGSAVCGTPDSSSSLTLGEVAMEAMRKVPLRLGGVRRIRDRVVSRPAGRALGRLRDLAVGLGGLDLAGEHLALVHADVG